MANGKWQMEMQQRMRKRSCGSLRSSASPHFPFSIFHFPSRQRARAGFSFAEVMFAVVILGVGFIMVAAIFPVAIQQSQVTGGENFGASVAREGVNVIAALPPTVKNLEGTLNTPPNGTIGPPRSGYPVDLPMFPPTVKNYSIITTTTPPVGVVPPPAVVASFTGPRWEAIKRSLINASDARYAYVPFYKRENGSSVAQVIVIAVEVRNRSIYEPQLDVGFSAASNQVRSITVTTTPGNFLPVPTTNINICPDIIDATVITGPSANEGDSVSISPTYGGTSVPRGRTYRLGRQTGISRFDLEPGDGIIQDGGSDGLWGTRDATAATPVTDLLDYPVTSLLVPIPGGAVPSPSGLAPPATLQPQVAYAQLRSDSSSPGGRISLYTDAVSNNAPAFAATGAFVVIADDYPFDPATNGGTFPAAGPYKVWPNVVTGVAPNQITRWALGALNGRIFRLGQPAPNGIPGEYDLDPAYGMRAPQGVSKYSPDTMPNPDLITYDPALSRLRAKVYMIGRGRADPTNANGASAPVEYTGAAQDVAVYTTFIAVQ